MVAEYGGMAVGSVLMHTQAAAAGDDNGLKESSPMKTANGGFGYIQFPACPIN